jgi:hypothetical protein
MSYLLRDRKQVSPWIPKDIGCIYLCQRFDFSLQKYTYKIGRTTDIKQREMQLSRFPKYYSEDVKQFIKKYYPLQWIAFTPVINPSFVEKTLKDAFYLNFRLLGNSDYPTEQFSGDPHVMCEMFKAITKEHEYTDENEILI